MTDTPELDDLARDLTRAVLLHYGYELAAIVEAEEVHHGRVCAEQCFDEETGDSRHGPIHDELGAMAAVMVDVIEPEILRRIAGLPREEDDPPVV